MTDNDRINYLENELKDLAEKQNNQDKLFIELNTTLRDYSGWVKALEQTIRHLDDSYKEMIKHHQRIPLERMQDIKEWLNPVHIKLDEHEEIFITKKDLKTLILVSLFFIGALSTILTGFSIYVISDVKQDIVREVKVNNMAITQNAEYIEIHDESRIEILRKLHTHENGGL
jgi:phosphoenolpyruvate carboxylase